MREERWSVERSKIAPLGVPVTNFEEWLALGKNRQTNVSRAKAFFKPIGAFFAQQVKAW